MGAGNVLEGTSWRAVEGIDHLDTVTVTAEFDTTTVAGTGGCNRYRASYVFDGERFGLTGPVVATLMACAEPQMTVEASFLARLAQAERVRVGEDGLVLLDAGGAALVVFRRLGSADLVGQWVVTSMHVPSRRAVVGVDGHLALTFTPAAVYGEAGDIAFQGPWSIDGSRLRIGPLATTAMHAPGPATATGHALLDALGSVAGWSLAGDHLELRRADGGIALTLQRPDRR